MNNLYNEKEFFNDIILAASRSLGINSAIIEKDYYVTLLLKNIIERNSDIIFKGGTSLSKCYKVINRFSEDIDLGLNVNKATEGMKKSLKRDILNAIDDLNFKLDNADDIRTRMDFNRYQITYPVSETVSFIKPYLYIETAVFLKPFPYEIKTADSYVYRFLKDANHKEIIDKYSLNPFEIKVQSLERTFIDKIFAIGDYYLTNNITGHSRHLYDLYKIMPMIKFDDNFYALFNEVKEIRKGDSACPSAKPNQNIIKLLKEIHDSDYFKSDYINVTKGLLFDNTQYDSVKENLKSITEIF